MMREPKTSSRTVSWILAVFIGLMGTGAMGLAESQPESSRPTATDIMGRSDRAFYYQGGDMKAKVRMDLVTADGKKQTRVLTMLRRNEGAGGNQKYFLYFHEPPDVRRMSFLVWKYPDKEDDRWVFIPALDLVRRIAASDARSSFVGSDFDYEDVSGRDLEADAHTLVREEKLDDCNCYVIESLPKKPMDYTKKVSWIDAQTFLPRKAEYYDQQEELARVFTADNFEEIAVGEAEERKAFPTVTSRTMKNVKSGHRTEVTFTSVSYNVGLTNDIFTERYLRRPPEKWIK